MKKIIFLFFVSALFLQADILYAEKLVPMKDFFRNPEKAAYQLSPDGAKLSFKAPYKKRMNIFIQDTQLKNKPYRITSVTDRDIQGYFWKGNDHILYMRDFGGDENYHVFCVDLKTKRTKDLTPFKGARNGIMDDLEDISDDEVLMFSNKNKKEVFDIYSLNIITGKISMRAENPGNITDYGTDHQGRVRLAEISDGVNTDILYRESEDKPFKKIFHTGFKDTFNPQFFTFDDKDLYVASNMGRDKIVIVKYDVAAGKEREVLFKHPDVDVSGISYSKKRKVLLAASYYTSKQGRYFFDDEIKGIFEKIQKKLPEDVEIDISSTNKNEDMFIVTTYSDKIPGISYLYDVKKDALSMLTIACPWIKPEQMASMKPIEYKSRDGFTIHGYLTLPNNKEAKNLPVIINPHGGPWSRNRWDYNREVQFLANRGYAILQMNFRGSTGYGKKFWAASFKQWGLKMQDDISDGVKWIIEQGIADPDRVAIYGASYGGYATLAGMTFTPELYACGVDYVGISNLFTFLKTIPAYWKPTIEMWYEEVGNPEKDKELMTKVSPLFHVDNIKAPLLIAQGANDPRVNINESNQMVDALKKRGIKVPYIVKKNEGHGFRNEENRFDFYRAMEKFLAECVGNKKTGTGEQNGKHSTTN